MTAEDGYGTAHGGSRISAALSGLTGCCLAVYPPAGMALLVFHLVFIRNNVIGLRVRELHAGLLWHVAIAGLTLLGLLHIRSGGFQLVWFAGALVLMKAAAGVLRRTAWMIGVIIGLVFSVALGIQQREVSRTLWPVASTVGATYGIVKNVSVLDGKSGGWTRNGVRLTEKTWTLPVTDGEFVLSLDLRRRAGRFGWQWLTYADATRQDLIESEAGQFVRLYDPAGKIVRRGRTPAGTVPEALRVSGSIRGSGEYASGNCGFSVRTFEPNASVCLRLDITEEWQHFVLELPFPSESIHGGFSAEFQPLDLEWVDVSEFKAEFLQHGEWREVKDVEPAAIHLSVPIPGLHPFRAPAVDVTPGDDWETFRLLISPEQQLGTGEITVRLQQPPGVEIELRNATLRNAAPGGSQPRAIPSVRSAYLLGDSNLAGHTFTMLGLAMLAAGSVGPLQVTGFAAAVGAVIMTGSRTAWLVLILAGASLFWAAVARRWRFILAGIGAAAILAVLLLDGTAVLGRLNLERFTAANSVSRPEIWAAALKMITENPLTGLGITFGEQWSALHPNSRGITPLHAHNLWLQLGVKFGVPGLLAAVILTVAFFVMAWTKGRLTGVILVTASVVLNVMDYTFTFPGVYLALLCGLMLAADDHHRTPLTSSPGMKD